MLDYLGSTLVAHELTPESRLNEIKVRQILAQYSAVVVRRCTSGFRFAGLRRVRRDHDR